MLRSTNTTLRAVQPTWRPSLSALRQQSTLAAAVVAEPVQAQEPAKPLSARASAGRGMPLKAAASDPFTEFLKNAKLGNNSSDRNRRPGNNNNNNNRRDFKKTAAPGQFDDAAERPRQQYKQRTQPQHSQQQRQPRTNNNNNNNNNNSSSSSSSSNYKNGNNRTNRAGPANRPPRQQRAAPRSSAPAIMNAPTRRVTTFIDKDIDWNTMTGFSVEEAEGQADGTTAAATDADKAAIASGEYQPFLDVTKQVQWSQPINVDALSNLVGGNASYGLDQKTAFLSALATATGSSVSATTPQ